MGGWSWARCSWTPSTMIRGHRCSSWIARPITRARQTQDVSILPSIRDQGTSSLSLGCKLLAALKKLLLEAQSELLSVTVRRSFGRCTEFPVFVWIMGDYLWIYHGDSLSFCFRHELRNLDLYLMLSALSLSLSPPLSLCNCSIFATNVVLGSMNPFCCAYKKHAYLGVKLHEPPEILVFLVAD
jgi:hypothetical protein